MGQGFLTASRLGAFSKAYHYFMGGNDLLPFHAWGEDGSFAIDMSGRVVLLHSFSSLCDLNMLLELKEGERIQIFTSFRNGMVSDIVVCVAVPVVYNYRHWSLSPVVSLNPVERECKKLVQSTEDSLKRALALMPRGGDDVVRSHRLGSLYWPFGGIVRNGTGDYSLVGRVSCNGEVVVVQGEGKAQSEFSVVLNVPTPDQVGDSWIQPVGDFLAVSIVTRQSKERNDALVRQTFAKGSFVRRLEGQTEGVDPSDIHPLAFSQFYVMNNPSARTLVEDVHKYMHEMMHSGNCVDKVCLALGDTLRALVPGGNPSPFVTFIDQPLVAECIAAFHRC